VRGQLFQTCVPCVQIVAVELGSVRHNFRRAPQTPPLVREVLSLLPDVLISIHGKESRYCEIHRCTILMELTRPLGTRTVLFT